MHYIMRTNGSTHGAVTGRLYKWAANQVVNAPEGEFDHLGRGRYETRPMRPAGAAPAPQPAPEPEPEPEPLRIVETKPGGWHLLSDGRNVRTSQAEELGLL